MQVTFSISETPNITQCHHNVRLEDETETTTWSEFQDKLEQYSGMKLDNYSIDVNCDSNLKCIINHHGTAVWEARFVSNDPQ